MVNLAVAILVLILSAISETLLLVKQKRRADLLRVRFQDSPVESRLRWIRPVMAGVITWFLMSRHPW